MSIVKTKDASKKASGEENSLEKITASLKKYILTPVGLFGISGFVFDIDGDSVSTFQNNITDNHVEDNSVVNDHVAKMPEKITLTKYVGELVHRHSESSAKTKVGGVLKKLTPIIAALPAITSASSAIKNRISGGGALKVEDLDQADNLYGIFQNLNPWASNQQKAYIFLKALSEQGVLMSLQTPFGYYRKMAIETLVATQKEDSNDISTFTITLKQMRFASITTTEFDKEKYQGRAGSQNAEKIKNGKTGGSQSDGTIAFQLAGKPTL